MANARTRRRDRPPKAAVSNCPPDLAFTEAAMRPSRAAVGAFPIKLARGQQQGVEVSGRPQAGPKVDAASRLRSSPTAGEDACATKACRGENGLSATACCWYCRFPISPYPRRRKSELQHFYCSVISGLCLTPLVIPRMRRLSWPGAPSMFTAHLFFRCCGKVWSCSISGVAREPSPLISRGDYRGAGLWAWTAKGRKWSRRGKLPRPRA